MPPRSAWSATRIPGAISRSSRRSPAAEAEVAGLRDAGFAGAGIFRIPAAVGQALVVRPFGGAPIRFSAGVSLTAEPPGDAFLEWEGRPYRGLFTVFRSGGWRDRRQRDDAR